MTLYEAITAAVRDLSENGYSSPEQLEMWLARLREAATQTLRPPRELQQQLNDTLRAIYDRLITKGRIVEYHVGVSRYQLERVKPKLRAELDRRIMASADLIKRNREQAIEKTLQRFSGWATSIPKGGSLVDKNDTKGHIRKAMAQLPFEERRVMIDQGHKLTAALSETLASDGGALALVWKSHWRQAGYDYRPDHKERDGHVYALRDNWAIKAGLMKAGDYYDQITAVAQEPFCRCFAKWIYNLGSLPDEMLTQKGRAELERVKAGLRA